MKEENKELLENEISSELISLTQLELGSDGYKTTIDGVTKLTDRLIELEKSENDAKTKETSMKFDYDIKTKQLEADIEKANKDADERYLSRISDKELKEKQLKEDKKGRIITNVITITTFVVSTGVTIWGACRSWRFEKEDTITSPTSRSLLNRLFGKNK